MGCDEAEYHVRRALERRHFSLHGGQEAEKGAGACSGELPSFPSVLVKALWL